MLTKLDMIYGISMGVLFYSFLGLTYVHFSRPFLGIHNRHCHIISTISGYCTINYDINLLFTFSALLLVLYVLQTCTHLPLSVIIMCNLLFPIVITFHDVLIADVIHGTSFIVLVIFSVMYSHYGIYAIWISFGILYSLSSLFNYAIKKRSCYFSYLGNKRENINIYYSANNRLFIYAKIIAYLTIITEYVGVIYISYIIYTSAIKSLL